MRFFIRHLVLAIFDPVPVVQQTSTAKVPVRVNEKNTTENAFNRVTGNI